MECKDKNWLIKIRDLYGKGLQEKYFQMGLSVHPHSLALDPPNPMRRSKKINFYQVAPKRDIFILISRT